MSLVLFSHILGSAFWIGGGVAALVVAFGAREEPPEVQAGAYRILVRVHTMVIGLGALLVVGSGVLLMMSMSTGGLGDMMREPRLWVMIVTGLIGGMMVMFVGLPTAVRAGALAVASKTGDFPPAFAIYRRRLGVISTAAGALAVLSLFSWYVF